MCRRNDKDLASRTSCKVRAKPLDVAAQSLLGVELDLPHEKPASPNAPALRRKVSDRDGRSVNTVP